MERLRDVAGPDELERHLCEALDEYRWARSAETNYDCVIRVARAEEGAAG